jgi:Spy/CpxP family protein refolding chaperone
MNPTPNAASASRRSRLTLAVVASAIALGTFAALKLPAGPMPGNGLGPSLHAMHDGDIGPALPRVLERAKARLDLDAEQQRLWNDVAARSKAASDTVRTSREQVKAKLISELAKAEPDLNVIAGTADPILLEVQEERRRVRDLWLDLYARLSPEQKAVVRDLLRDRLSRAEAYHDRIREQMRQRGGRPSAPTP